jgi:hypothetical protein
MMLILQTVLAAEPSTYAVVAPVSLPPTGPVRVALGPDLVGGRPDDLEAGLLLTDAQGQALPYTVLLSSGESTLEDEYLVAVPEAADTWEVRAADAPIDRLSLDVDSLDTLVAVAATVTWTDHGVPGHAGPTLLYHMDDGTAVESVDLPHVSGPFRVTLRPLRAGDEPRLSRVDGQRYPPDHVPPVEEHLPMPAPTITEEGYARYVLHLGGARDVTGLVFDIPAVQDAFQRHVQVQVPVEPQGYVDASTAEIRRLRVGAANVDHVEMPVHGQVGDTLVVEVQLDRGRPLDITGVTVRSRGAWLLARDAGPDPHAIYGGATELDAAYDLSAAASELLRLSPPLVQAGPAAPNPTYVPLPTRTGVDEAGPDLKLSRFHLQRAIEGAPGWSRVVLDRDVLAHARPDLADLRVVDAEGRQVPFSLRRTGDEEPWETPAFERTEEGSATLLRVPLGSTAPVATVSIDTGHDVFVRDVTILRDAGKMTIPVRRVSWSGLERGGTLTIGVDESLGDTLLVRIENGDNPPLPIDAVRVTSARWEVRARLPEGGARLVYGAANAELPSYDLSLLQPEVLRLLVADATLGPEESLAPPALGAVDTGMTVIGVGLLVLGLLGMVVRVLRGVPGPADGEGARG